MSRLDYASAKAELVRMVEGRRITRAHIEAVEHSIRTEARHAALDGSTSTRARMFAGSVTSYWTKADHARHKDARARIEDRRARELGALRRKLARQEEAIAALVRRHGFNEVPA